MDLTEVLICQQQHPSKVQELPKNLVSKVQAVVENTVEKSIFNYLI